MKKSYKKIIIITTIIIIVVALVIIFLNPLREKLATYKLIENDNDSYKYVDSYSEYLSFTESTIRVNELKESDFDGEKSYLIYIAYFDSKNEIVKSYEMKEEEKTNKIYFDISLGCSEYYSIAHAYVFETENNNNSVEAYSKVISREKCSK